MSPEHFSGAGIGSYFGVPEAAVLEVVPVESAVFYAAKLTKTLGGGQFQEARIPTSDAYLLMIYLEDALHADIDRYGTRTAVNSYRRGLICLIDLFDGAAFELHSDLHALALVLPKALLLEIARISTFTRNSKLICKRRHPDEVLSNLATALVSLFDASGLVLPALLKSMALAVCAHLLHDYCDKFMCNGVSPSSLSVEQEKAAKEYMIENLGRELSVVEISSATGLSPNHFTREFRRATGITPYQWLMKIRIDHAKDLLPTSAHSLKDIATECGFTDQSHLTKVFARETGSTPAAWRHRKTH